MIATLYLFIGIGSLLSSSILQTIGIKLCFVAGSTTYLLFVLASTLAAWKASDSRVSDKLIKSSLLVSVALNGLGAALIWVA